MSVLEKVLCAQRIMFVLLLLGGVFYTCLLGLIGFRVLFESSVSFLVFSLVVLSIIECGVLNSLPVEY